MKQPNHSYYFDYASCTPIDESIYETYCKLLKTYYVNPESMYSIGLETHKLVETSREKIAKLLGVLPSEVFFTSGASEANSFAIKGFALKNKHRGNHIITSKMEHSSVLNALKQLEEEFGFQVTYLPVNKKGNVTLDMIKQAIQKDTIMVSLMSVNNEVGSIQEIEAIGEHLKKNTRIVFMSDGVQILGKHAFSLKNIDLFTFTTHKIYGVKGCGVLIKKENIQLLPLINGGQQEQGLRGGTLNAPAIIVAAKTIRMALDGQVEHTTKVNELWKLLWEGLQEIDDIVLNSSIGGTPYILNFSCLSINSEIMMNALNQRNIFVSSQSACSSRTRTPSHTILAMGYDEQRALGGIRVSLSHLNTKAEIQFLLKSIKEIIDEYRT
ncbi:cysteine desulfurase [Breznakia sp. PF5-3]|uniref:cysteine desulfurase family protein n=1 Tax=unclassified Breznakia TaxID=2623764 RepID=UPI0024063DC6|nr:MULTISPECIES: cysteine desulfurase family protein [unclassified Breznakia]MDF9823928.1 cysteine desulfurase [Breznakia sp. PM6-1]MDF9834727.1 cysteine desulfurase [Breznakia sp. PF5-3]MDF9836838.1 cysteine desulfurase [Breznakia sp. PFB2-8]MDF9858855.1 cysteine desulfurase [Breznakia sp. PH5-24]